MLSIWYGNIRVFGRDKGTQLEADLRQYDVLIFVEWGRSEGLKTFWEQRGYVSFFNTLSVKSCQADGRPQRGPGAGEGICIFVKQALRSTLVSHTAFATVVEISKEGSLPVAVGGVYVPNQGSPHLRRDPNLSPSQANEVAYQSVRDSLLEAKARGGQVLMFGDFNCHPGVAADIDPTVQAVVESLGMESEGAVSGHVSSLRASQAATEVDARGKLFIDHCCLETGCFLLNGRAPGDELGECTRGHACLDFGITDMPTFSWVQRFQVMPNIVESDHRPLGCWLSLGAGAPQAPPAATAPLPPRPRWAPDKREDYVRELSTTHSDALVALQRDVGSGAVSPEAGLDQLFDMVCAAGIQAMGRVEQGPPRIPSGQIANAWFPHCKAAYQAVRQAIRRGDTHAAAQFRQEFKAQKKRWKRHYEQLAHTRMLDELKHNPRKFWTAFKGRRPSILRADMQQLHSYWSTLYAGVDRGALGEDGEAMSDLVARLNGLARASSGYAHAAGLNSDITLTEMLRALKRLHPGRAAGPDGLRAEFLKYASWEVRSGRSYSEVHLLAPVLVALFQQLFSHGLYVRSWSSATLSPVFKKGDATNLDNYRAIAVGSVFGKLYAVLLDARLSVCAERHNWRAEGQAGFRPGKSTSDHIFVLRHLVEKAQLSPGPPLFCCFVDFKKAYDLVRRDLLMQRLAELGVHGHMLEAITQMYWEVPLVPKHDGTLGASINSTCGVKQGDPLSPLLFGLFIDEFESWLSGRLPAAGVQMGTKLVQMLLYADDMALLARSPGELQQMLDLLAEFSDAKHMVVSVPKTEVVVFRKPASRPQPNWQWTYKGERVQQSAEFRYLGIIFHETRGVSAAISSLATAARRAMWAMLSRFKMARMVDINLKLSMFSSLVLPIMEYCGEVWGPGLLSSADGWAGACNNELQRVQNLFLRQLGHLRSTVSTQIMHTELCKEPVARGWVRASVALWERLQAAPASSLLGAAARESLELAQTSDWCRQRCWAGQFLGMLDTLLSPHDASGCVSEFVSCGGRDGADLMPLEVDTVLDAWELMLRGPMEAALGVDPTTAAADLVRPATYQSWFCTPPDSEEEGFPTGMPKYVRHTAGIPFAHMKALMRLRTGAHCLAIEMGRWGRSQGGRGRVNRDERVCQKCLAPAAPGVPAVSALEDEVHFLFECPAYDSIRARFDSALFSAFGGSQAAKQSMRSRPIDVRRFMDQDPAAVAAFVHQCWEVQRDRDATPPAPAPAPVRDQANVRSGRVGEGQGLRPVPRSLFSYAEGGFLTLLRQTLIDRAAASGLDSLSARDRSWLLSTGWSPPALPEVATGCPQLDAGDRLSVETSFYTACSELSVDETGEVNSGPAAGPVQGIGVDARGGLTGRHPRLAPNGRPPVEGAM